MQRVFCHPANVRATARVRSRGVWWSSSYPPPRWERSHSWCAHWLKRAEKMAFVLKMSLLLCLKGWKAHVIVKPKCEAKSTKLREKHLPQCSSLRPSSASLRGWKDQITMWPINRAYNNKYYKRKTTAGIFIAAAAASLARFNGKSSSLDQSASETAANAEAAEHVQHCNCLQKKTFLHQKSKCWANIKIKLEIPTTKSEFFSL